ADGLENEVLEGLQVAQILLLRLELLSGGAVPLADTAGDDRHGEEGRGVEEHRDQLERRRFLGRFEEHAQRKHGAAHHDPRVEQAGHRRDREPARDERPGRQQRDGSPEPRPGESQERPADGERFHYFINVTRRKIGRYIATTRPPTTTPRNTIMMGSSRDVSAVTAVSTSSS